MSNPGDMQPLFVDNGGKGELYCRPSAEMKLPHLYLAVEEGDIVLSPVDAAKLRDYLNEWLGKVSG